MRSVLSAILLTFYTSFAMAGEIHVAVASNFLPAAKQLAREFAEKTGHQVTLAGGSTGKLYAQITHGAPFEAFFAADEKRPKLLEQQGVALPGSRFTYAIGRLVLWSPRTALVDPQGEVLKSGDFRHLALANPKLAPYGRAAEQVLRKLKRWDALQERLVRGENIGQTCQFVKSGNAALGFVARSQLRQPGTAAPGSIWEVPQALYDPLLQQAVLLKQNDAAQAFLAFVRSEAGRKIIRQSGYDTP
ncbi:MAG: molybdate ABC transporter substrate-binding protein [Gammaproteobacteria bacterium]|nr:MAG: molybdate ABC transporter substrate-binding protein [Gammaproteobacteria bacterium]